MRAPASPEAGGELGRGIRASGSSGQGEVDKAAAGGVACYS